MRVNMHHSARAGWRTSLASGRVWQGTPDAVRGARHNRARIGDGRFA
jgi:hypothetical protein